MDDQTFIENVQEAYKPVGVYHLTVNKNTLTGQVEVHTHEHGNPRLVARFDPVDEDLAVWLAIIHDNYPRLASIIHDLERDLDQVEREKDNLIGELIGLEQ